MLTVITPAASTALTTLSAVKSELGISSSADDAKLAGYIEQASSAISRECNRVFAREEVEETFRICDMQSALMLSRFPVSSVSTIVENGETPASGDYEVEAETGTLRRLRNDERSLWRRGKIVVTYSAGFVLPDLTSRDLPSDIERAAIMLVARYYSADPQAQLLRRETVEGIGSTELFAPSSSGLPPEVEALLARYRQVAL